MKKAKYRSIPCYYNPDTAEIKGRNMLYDLLIEINVYWDFYILGLEELPIWIEED